MFIALLIKAINIIYGIHISNSYIFLQLTCCIRKNRDLLMRNIFCKIIYWTLSGFACQHCRSLKQWHYSKYFYALINHWAYYARTETVSFFSTVQYYHFCYCKEIVTTICRYQYVICTAWGTWEVEFQPMLSEVLLLWFGHYNEKCEVQLCICQRPSRPRHLLVLSLAM